MSPVHVLQMSPVHVLQMSPVHVLQMSPVHVLQMSPVHVLQNESSPCFTNDPVQVLQVQSSPCFTTCPLYEIILHEKLFQEQDACRGVHSACRREVNRRKLDICVLRFRQGRIQAFSYVGQNFLVLKWGGGLD